MLGFLYFFFLFQVYALSTGPRYVSDIILDYHKQWKQRETACLAPSKMLSIFIRVDLFTVQQLGQHNLFTELRD